MNAALLALVFVVQDTVVLKPVVVTATRVPTPAASVSSAVTVLSGDSLRARGIRTVAEALRETLGAAVVETAGYGSHTSLFMRGGESDYVKVLLDGVPLNHPGGAYDFAHLTTDDVERIEIVRGPVSVLYGSDAVAGVIQIFTRAGAGPPRVEASVEGGTYGANRVGLNLTGGQTGLSYSIAASRFATGGLYPVNSEYRNATYTGRVRVAPDPRSDLALTVRHEDDVVHYPTDGAGRVVDANQFATDRGPAISLDVGRWLSNRLELRALVGWHESDGRVDDRPDDAGDTTGVYLFRSHDLMRRRSVDVRASWRAAPATMLTAGLAVEGARLRSTNQCAADFGSGPFDCSSPALDTTRSTRALLVQALTGIGQPVSTTLSARLEDNSQFGTLATWRAGAVWRLDPATRLRASLGTGFKDPTLFENFSSTPFATGNPDLRPERTSSWEAGIEHTLPGTDLSVAVTYFDQRFADLVLYDASRTPNFWNLAEARASGAEVAMTWLVRRGLAASVDYTYLDTRVLDGGGDPTFETGKRLIRRPTNAGAVRLTYALAERGTAALSVRFVGDRDDLDFSTFPAARVTLHPYARVDLAAAYDLRRLGDKGPAVALTARVENALNDPAHEIVGFRSRGRAVLVGGTFSFGP
ncbi:MAG TPA: TonB-dependent receptor [Gemmatimonadales bacterium]|jgi:vitamin B12 transporter|nr:TonB-dependent receptor [Gemmatimonadales bacterium]